jgi:hypothetical protein
MMRWLIEQPDAALSHSFENPKLLPGSRELKEMGLAFLAKKNPKATQSILSRLPPEQQAGLLSPPKRISLPFNPTSS